MHTGGKNTGDGKMGGWDKKVYRWKNANWRDLICIRVLRVLLSAKIANARWLESSFLLHLEDKGKQTKRGEGEWGGRNKLGKKRREQVEKETKEKDLPRLIAWDMRLFHAYSTSPRGGNSWSLFLPPSCVFRFFLPPSFPSRSLFPPRFSFLSEEKLAPSLSSLLERFPRTSNPILSREVSPRY